MTEQLKSEVERAIAQARSAALASAGNAFAERAAAIEYLEVHVIARLHSLNERGEATEALHTLGQRAEALQQRLEAANERFLKRVRARIRDDRYTPAGLERAFARYATNLPADRDYEVLDLLIAGLLEAGALEDERVEREPEMVAYQPTPGRMILELLARTKLSSDDVLIDLGAGLGWVVILAALLRNARAIGIELEPSFVDYARACIRALDVSRVELVLADARDAPLSEGTVFFLYTPFRGQMLQRVLERIRVEAQARAIRVCTYGPCTVEVAAADWLEPRAGNPANPHEVVVFERRHG